MKVKCFNCIKVLFWIIGNMTSNFDPVILLSEPIHHQVSFVNCL